MAKLKRKFIKMAVEEESELSSEELTEKLDTIIDRQYRRNLNKLRSAPVFMWSKVSEDEYRLKFYHSYKEDMCDTMMSMHIEKGLERSSIHGFIHKPAAIWAVFWGVIASVLIDFIIITYCILFVGGFDLINGLVISGCVSLVRIYICVSLLEISRDRVKHLRSELMRVIRRDSEALPAEENEEEFHYVPEEKDEVIVLTEERDDENERN